MSARKPPTERKPTRKQQAIWHTHCQIRAIAGRLELLAEELVKHAEQLLNPEGGKS
jgi:hypothetical protein